MNGQISRWQHIVRSKISNRTVGEIRSVMRRIALMLQVNALLVFRSGSSAFRARCGCAVYSRMMQQLVNCGIAPGTIRGIGILIAQNHERS